MGNRPPVFWHRTSDFQERITDIKREMAVFGFYAKYCWTDLNFILSPAQPLLCMRHKFNFIIALKSDLICRDWFVT